MFRKTISLIIATVTLTVLTSCQMNNNHTITENASESITTQTENSEPEQTAKEEIHKTSELNGITAYLDNGAVTLKFYKPLDSYTDGTYDIDKNSFKADTDGRYNVKTLSDGYKDICIASLVRGGSEYLILLTDNEKIEYVDIFGCIEANCGFVSMGQIEAKGCTELKFNNNFEEPAVSGGNGFSGSISGNIFDFMTKKNESLCTIIKDEQTHTTESGGSYSDIHTLSIDTNGTFTYNIYTPDAEIYDSYEGNINYVYDNDGYAYCVYAMYQNGENEKTGTFRVKFNSDNATFGTVYGYEFFGIKQGETKNINFK